MRFALMLAVLITYTVLLSSCTDESSDPYLWLEAIDDPTALAWVEERNQSTMEDLQAYPEYESINADILEILNSDERIAYPSIVGDWIYNFWQDETHERGLWRRCSLSEYMKESPAWETVLDLDALCEREGRQWAFKGASFCYPDYDRCILRLSNRGSDAVEMREFDLQTKSFVANGFTVPPAKGSATWVDRDTLLIGTNFGPDTMTDSGYPRQVKLWKRGVPLSEAALLFEGEQTDVSVDGGVQETPGRQYVIVERGISFYTSEYFSLEGENLVKLQIPADAQLHGFFKNRMLVELKSDWTAGGQAYRQGSLIAIDYDRFLAGARDFDVIVRPAERSSLAAVALTKDTVLVEMLNNVRSELHQFVFDSGKWQSQKIPAPDYGQISIVSDDQSDRYFFTYENFLTPGSLYYVADASGDPRKVKSLPEFFDGSKFEVEQRQTASRDGTQIPYFLVYPKGMQYDGSNPTLLYGYGGFEISLLPRYSPVQGRCWLEKGGVYVLANIRGGGEFGPRWHQAALRENRQRAYDDFIAVSEDLVRRRITSPDHLGIMGGSNGGLLVSAVFTQRPDLYNAVVCSVPLCDMKRYNKLLAGASWMGEFGNPDLPQEWGYIKRYSPYHNLSKSGQYPKVLFTTTTRDDRVHPGHARKMAAKMEGLGHPVFYFENTEGGHGAGVTNRQRALMVSLEYTYLLTMLAN